MELKHVRVVHVLSLDAVALHPAMTLLHVGGLGRGLFRGGGVVLCALVLFPSRGLPDDLVSGEKDLLSLPFGLLGEVAAVGIGDSVSRCAGAVWHCPRSSGLLSGNLDGDILQGDLLPVDVFHVVV